jgi:hypothetical protein
MEHLQELPPKEIIHLHFQEPVNAPIEEIDAEVNDTAAATLTGTSNQITVTNAANAITLSTPQDIHTTAAVSFTSASISSIGAFTGS